MGSKASYYVSFDNVRVGKLQGQGLVAALKANGKYSQHPVIAELNGALTDNNAHLFKQGYDSILNPLYKAGIFKKADAGDQWTNWNYVKAATIFTQMLTRNSNTIDGVLAANDGIAGAVISDLKNASLNPIPLTGQDATPTGAQYILAGWQSGTVYKSVKREAARGRGSGDQGAPPAEGAHDRQGQWDTVDPVGAAVDHQVEHQDPVHGRVLEGEPGLHRRVQAVLHAVASTPIGVCGEASARTPRPLRAE